MKKYVWLGLGTALLVLLIVGIGAWTRPTESEVSTVTVTAQTVKQHVMCTGKIENAGSYEVFVDAPCIAGTVYVTEGQRVKKDEVLFAVDTDATKQALAALGASVPSGSGAFAKTEITAPTDGVVTMLKVKTGEITDHSTPCAVIAAGDGIQVTVAVRERHLPNIRVGQEAVVSGVAFTKERYSGTVVSVAKTAHQQYIGSVSETVVDAVIALKDGEADESLRVGLNAKAEVVIGLHEDALLLPYDCVAVAENGEEYVYVYGSDGSARRRVVVLGEECADGVLVVSGLSSGERVVQTPEALSGELVRVRER